MHLPWSYVNDMRWEISLVINKTGNLLNLLNLTLRRTGVTIIAVEKQWVLHILSVCLYP
jgi:hypothetical protein